MTPCKSLPEYLWQAPQSHSISVRKSALSHVTARKIRWVKLYQMHIDHGDLRALAIYHEQPGNEKLLMAHLKRSAQGIIAPIGMTMMMMMMI